MAKFMDSYKAKTMRRGSTGASCLSEMREYLEVTNLTSLVTAKCSLTILFSFPGNRGFKNYPRFCHGTCPTVGHPRASVAHGPQWDVVRDVRRNVICGARPAARRCPRGVRRDDIRSRGKLTSAAHRCNERPRGETSSAACKGRSSAACGRTSSVRCVAGQPSRVRQAVLCSTRPAAGHPPRLR